MPTSGATAPVDDRDRSYAKVASLIFLTLAVVASVSSTGAMTAHRSAFIEKLNAMEATLPLVTRVALSLPFAWLPALLGIAALAKEPLVRDPFLRLKLNGGQFVLAFVLVRCYIWAAYAPLMRLMDKLSG